MFFCRSSGCHFRSSSVHGDSWQEGQLRIQIHNWMDHPFYSGTFSLLSLRIRHSSKEWRLSLISGRRVHWELVCRVSVHHLVHRLTPPFGPPSHYTDANLNHTSSFFSLDFDFALAGIKSINCLHLRENQYALLCRGLTLDRFWFCFFLFLMVHGL